MMRKDTHGLKVVKGGELGGPVRECNARMVLLRNPSTVVRDLDESEPAAKKLHRDHGGARVQRVLNELLHRRAHVQDDLAAADLADCRSINRSHAHQRGQDSFT